MKRKSILRIPKAIAFIVIVLNVLACKDASALNVKDGDIIFHTSKSSQSMAIQRATNSPYSHMGIIFYRDGKPYVFEAIKTVRYTPLKKWIERGEGKHFVIKRLRDADRILTSESIDKLKKEAQRYKGRPYDQIFEWNDDRIYCSELVWKIYDRGLGIKIGKLQKLKDFNLSDPIVQQKMKDRYQADIPFEEPAISPGEMFNASNILTVIER